MVLSKQRTERRPSKSPTYGRWPGPETFARYGDEPTPGTVPSTKRSTGAG